MKIRKKNNNDININNESYKRCDNINSNDNNNNLTSLNNIWNNDSQKLNINDVQKKKLNYNMKIMIIKKKLLKIIYLLIPLKKKIKIRIIIILKKNRKWELESLENMLQYNN